GDRSRAALSRCPLAQADRPRPARIPERHRPFPAVAAAPPDPPRRAVPPRRPRTRQRPDAAGDRRGVRPLPPRRAARGPRRAARARPPARRGRGADRARLCAPACGRAAASWALRMAGEWRARRGDRRAGELSAAVARLRSPLRADGRLRTFVDGPPMERSDHPAHLLAHGLVPPTGTISDAAAADALEDALADRDWHSTWGWAR